MSLFMFVCSLFVTIAILGFDLRCRLPTARDYLDKLSALKLMEKKSPEEEEKQAEPPESDDEDLDLNPSTRQGGHGKVANDNDDEDNDRDE